MIRIGGRGGPGTSDPGTVTFQRTSLAGLVMEAYDVGRYQLSGPNWLDDDRFDIVAKAPAGATKEQVKLMLRNLLAERFQLTLHREKKEMPAYSLVAGKNGSKMKESAEGLAPTEAVAPPPLPSDRPQLFTVGKDGFPTIPGGYTGPSTIILGDRARMQARRESMRDFAVSLSRELNRPVVDRTSLKGKYDFILYWSPDNAVPIASPSPPPGPTGADPMPGLADGETYPDLAAAIQQQLGLRLEAKKAPVDILAIDRAERVPAAN
jgi:uncharacterized protein (TIGR03435 family)